jgi:hypothetical protein
MALFMQIKGDYAVIITAKSTAGKTIYLKSTGSELAEMHGIILILCQ